MNIKFHHFLYHYRQALQNPPDNADTTEQPKVEDIVPIVFKECKKEKIEYRIEALKCLGAILHAHQIDKFKDLADILFPIVRKVSTIIVLSFAHFMGDEQGLS